MEIQPSTVVGLSLKPPVILLLQTLEAVLSSIGNIQQNFAGSGIQFDPFYLLKKYVPQIDWKDFEKSARDYQASQKAAVRQDQPPGGFQGGGQY